MKAILRTTDNLIALKKHFQMGVLFLRKNSSAVKLLYDKN